VALLAFAAEGPQRIPNYDFQGDTVREHRGQPDFCISHNTTRWLANCTCKEMPAAPGRKDDCGRNARPVVRTKCKTECRNRCYCEPPRQETE
jgi:hypothetical protein